MKTLNSKMLLLIGSVSIIGLTGCGQVEQAANEVLDKAKQAAVQALDEAQQSGSIDQARESANQIVQQARQQAAGILGQASEYLSQQNQALENQEGVATPVENAPIAL